MFNNLFFLNLYLTLKKKQKNSSGSRVHGQARLG